MIRTIIVDDERHASELLGIKLAKLDLGVEVLAKFNHPEAAVEFIRGAKFDVLFLDIEMPRLSGFDLLDALGTINFEVIFTTAYDQYAIRAFEFSALNYLLKPVEEAQLRSVLLRWEERKNRDLSVAQLDVLRQEYRSASQQRNLPARVALPMLEGYEIIEIGQIIRCEAEGSYTRFYMADGRTLLICRILKQVAENLEAHNFIRAHQSHIINLSYLRKIIKIEGGYLLMADGSQIPVTKQKRDWLLTNLETLGPR